MAARPHILIIGAGLIGLSTADSLIARGAHVTLIDRRAGPGQGTSFCNSGMIHPSQMWPWHVNHPDVARIREWAAYAARSSTRLESKMQALGLPPALSQGSIQIVADAASRESLSQRYDLLGVACQDLKTPLWGRSGLFFPHDRTGNAHQYCCALARELKIRGAKFLFNVHTLTPDPHKAGLVVDGTLVSGDHIVIAAGPQTRTLAALWGVDVGIEPVVGHALNFEIPHGGLGDIPSCPIMDYESRSALTQFHTHVRISGSVDLKTPQDLLAVWKNIAPDIIGALGAPFSQWSGDRPVSTTGFPITERTNVPGLWINSGHGHMGWTLSAEAGEDLARQMMPNKS